MTETDTGGRAGAEVVQGHGSQDAPRLVRPNRELLAFDRVSLDIGEGTTVEGSIPATYFGCYRPGECHVVEVDTYRMVVGEETVSAPIDGSYL